jgi:antitoxin (DNA-binding transcriptional repressor) of toxin-antitoxin stability system
LLARVTAGEEIVIARSGKPIARLVPVAAKKRVPGIDKGKIWMAKDFSSMSEQELDVGIRIEKLPTSPRSGVI